MSLTLPEVPRGPRSLFGELLDWMLAPLLVRATTEFQKVSTHMTLTASSLK